MAMSLSRVIWRLGPEHSGGNGLICWMPSHFKRLMRDAGPRFSINENDGKRHEFQCVYCLGCV